MTNMVQTEIMQYHAIPIGLVKLVRYVSRHVVIHFSKILASISQLLRLELHYIVPTGKY